MRDPFKALGRGLHRAFRGKNPFKKKRRTPTPAQQQAIVARNHAQANTAAAPLVVPGPPPLHAPPGFAPGAQPAPLVVPGPPPLHAPPGFAPGAQPAPLDASEQQVAAAPEQALGWESREDGWRSLHIPGADAHDPSRTWYEHGRVGIQTHGLPSAYHGEQHHAAFRAPNYDGVMSLMNMEESLHGTDDFVTDVNHFATHYMSPEEQAEHSISFADGRLVQGGKLVDTEAAESTIGAHDLAELEQEAEHAQMPFHVPRLGADAVMSGPAGHGTAHSSGRGKHIFVMTPAGELRAVDPWAAKHVTPNATGSTMNFINHSSLVAGDEVAGAGELTVANGELQQVSDLSGHYKPDGVLMRQVISRLAQDVDMSNVDVKLGGKERVERGEGNWVTEGPLIGPAHEFMSHDPREAEKLMRARRRDLDGDLKRQIANDPRFRAHAMAMLEEEGDADARSTAFHDFHWEEEMPEALAAARRGRGLE